MLKFVVTAVVLDGLTVAAGAVGYRYCESLNWLDATANAAMVITSNGPVVPIQTPTGRLFAACHALIGCVVFVGVIAVLLTPVFHRLMHRFHLEMAEASSSALRS
jgi:hypothetical protein